MFNLTLKAMKRADLILSACLIMAAFAFTSCEKNDVEDPMVNTTQDDDEVSSYFDDVLAEADEVGLQNDGVMAPSPLELAYSATGGSGTRTVETSWDGDWKVKTITYQNYVNRNSQFERVKNGKIVMRILGNPLQSTFERRISFENFTINGNAIQGEKVIRKTSTYKYQISLTNGKVIFTDGTEYTREYTRTRTWSEGYNTPYNVWDDVYTLEGSSSGKNRKGNTYTHQITNPLVVKMSCRWIVMGTIEMAVDGASATLDYGNGECDNDAMVTVNGKTYAIKLRGSRNSN